MHRHDREISLAQMKKALRRSGYLMEQRIFPVLDQAGYYVESNPAYPDAVTGKSREYDFSATTGIKLYQGDRDFLFIHLIGECINNSLPIVFFKAESPLQFLFHQEIKCAGIPLYLHAPNASDEFVSLQDLFGFEKFHHYCHTNFSTQYCSFKKKSGKDAEWMAWHDEEHHGVLNSLVGATSFAVDEWFSGWVLPEVEEEEPVNLNLFYPLLILSGELYECAQSKGRFSLKKKNSLAFRKSIISNGLRETYQIDVITEPYLKTFLGMLDQEQEVLKSRFKKKKKQINSAIKHIVAKARGDKTSEKIKSFREILEF